MRTLKAICIVLFLISTGVQADSNERITIFHTDVHPVIDNVDLPSHIELNVYNLDDKRKADALLTASVKRLVDGNVPSSEVESAYRNAFDIFLNSEDWEPLYLKIKKGAMSVHWAERLKVTKVPAIIFNNKYVVYGVTSLQEAIDIYAEKG